MAADLRPPDPPPIINKGADVASGSSQPITNNFAGNFNRSFAQTVANSSTQQRSSQRVLPPLSYNPRTFAEKDGVPIVKFSQEEIREMEKQFTNTVVAKFSAGRPPMAKISEVISNEWGLAEPATLCLVDPRHILIHLKSPEDCVKALARDSNVMEKALYRVFRWDPDFSPKHEPVRMATWVKLPGLPTKFFNPDTLAVIGNAIGDFLRVDTRTNSFTFAMYARLCVEIDVTKPRKEKIWISTGGDTGFFQRIVYESRLLYCSKCGLHGHDLSICRKALGFKSPPIQERVQEKAISNEKSAVAAKKNDGRIQHTDDTFKNPPRIERLGNVWRFVQRSNPQPKKNILTPSIPITSPFAVLETIDDEGQDIHANSAQNIRDLSKEQGAESSSIPPKDLAKQQDIPLLQNTNVGLQNQDREVEPVLHHVEDSTILEKENENVVLDENSSHEPQNTSTSKRSNIGKSQVMDAPALAHSKRGELSEALYEYRFG